MKKEKFIAFFTKRRKELGLSQSGIANKLGVSDQAVSNWERGVSFPDLSLLSDISKILEVNVDSLILGKINKNIIKKDINFDVVRFSKYLSKLRKSKNLTQNQLGEMLEVPGQNISRFENGVFLPSIDVLIKYSEIFDVKLLNVYYGLEDEDLYDELVIEEEKKKKEKKKLNLRYSIIISIITIVFFIGISVFIINIINNNIKYTVLVKIEESVLSYEVNGNTKFELPDIPVKKGYDAKWNNNDTVINDDKTFSLIYTPKTYKIIYKFDDESKEDYVQEVKYDEAFELLKIDDSDFLNFMYLDKPFTDGVYQFDHDIVIKAKYINYYQVSVVFDKENIFTYTVKENEMFTLPELPEKTGYDVKWSNSNLLITKDTVFEVVYTPKTYKIIYKFDDESKDDFIQEVKYLEEFKLLDNNDPDFVTYLYLDEPFTNGIYKFDHDIIIRGKYSYFYQVSVILDKDNIQLYTVRKNEYFTLPQLPKKKGYESSWSDLDTLITNDKEFRVIYTAKKYNVTCYFENDLHEPITQEVTYGSEFSLTGVNVNNYLFVGYLYQGNPFDRGIYEFDYDISVTGYFSNETCDVYYQIATFFNEKKFVQEKFHLSGTNYFESIIQEEIFSPDELKHYKIKGWNTKEGTYHNEGDTYIIEEKKDIIFSPVFIYDGNAFEYEIKDDEVSIKKCNVLYYNTLIIPDYVLIDEKEYKVTGIEPLAFDNVYFERFFLSSHITKIKKDTFGININIDAIANMSSELYFNGTYKQWFEINFEAPVISVKRNFCFSLNINTSKFEIPKEVEVINSYACFGW